MGVRRALRATLAERGYDSDPAQLRAVAALERCENEWADYKARRGNALTKLLRHPPIPRGVYMYGGVGRGKSFLMDCFFNAVPLTRKTRLHFHEFMREVHRELQDLQGHGQPARRTRRAHRAALPADLLRRVPRRRRHRRDDPAPAAGGAVRSNRVAHRHDLELPSRRAVPERAAPRPHPAGDRAAEGQARGRSTSTTAPTTGAARSSRCSCTTRRSAPEADAAMSAAFDRLAEARDDDPVLHIEHRELRARRRAGGVVWFDFKHAVRRAALAERLPRARDAVPHRAAVRRAADAAAAGVGGAALHLAGRRAVRPARQADHVGRGAGRAALHRGSAGARVPAHGVAPARDAVGASSWRSRGATSTLR